MGSTVKLLLFIVVDWWSDLLGEKNYRWLATRKDIGQLWEIPLKFCKYYHSITCYIKFSWNTSIKLGKIMPLIYAVFLQTSRFGCRISIFHISIDITNICMLADASQLSLVMLYYKWWLFLSTNESPRHHITLMFFLLMFYSLYFNFGDYFYRTSFCPTLLCFCLERIIYKLLFPPFSVKFFSTVSIFLWKNSSKANILWGT